jgi:hypothetical protein
VLSGGRPDSVGLVAFGDTRNVPMWTTAASPRQRWREITTGNPGSGKRRSPVFLQFSWERAAVDQHGNAEGCAAESQARNHNKSGRNGNRPRAHNST